MYYGRPLRCRLQAAPHPTLALPLPRPLLTQSLPSSRPLHPILPPPTTAQPELVPTLGSSDDLQLNAHVSSIAEGSKDKASPTAITVAGEGAAEPMTSHS
jgi:hypothetical protein